MTTKKTLRCGTIFPGCDYVMHGETDADVLAKLADHAREAHEIGHIPDDLREKIVAHMAAEEGGHNPG